MTHPDYILGHRAVDIYTWKQISWKIYRSILFTLKMAENPNHAIIYGASGLIGWALVDQLLQSYLHADSFEKVTAVTNRPLDASKSYWPDSDPTRPELQLVSGVDLRRGDGAALAESLKQNVREIQNVTHVYYLGVSSNLSLLTTIK